ISAHDLATRFQTALLEHAKISADVRAAKLIVEGGGTDRRADHDLEGRGDALGLVRIRLPGFAHPRNVQIRDRKPAKARLGFGTDAGRTLVANLAAGAGGRT